MDIKELKSDKLNLHLAVTILAKDIDAEIEKQLLHISKTVRVDGFRVGKVPMTTVKKKYAASVRADVVSKKVSNAVYDIQKERKIRAIGEPKIEDFKSEDGKDIEFTLKYELLPEVSMPDWKKVSLEKPVLDVAEKDVNEALEKLAEMAVEYTEESKAKAKKGDQVTMDAVGYADGVAFDGGKLDSYKLVLGSGVFIPGFEDQLVGVKTGEEVKVEVTFPEDYHAKNLAGKPSVFECKILAVHKPAKTEVNDELAKKFAAENLEDLKSKVAQDIKASFDSQIDIIIRKKLFDQLENLLDFEIPESLLKQEVAILKDQAKDDIKEDEDLKNKSEKELDEYFGKLALRRVRLGLMLAEYSRIHDLKVTQEDIYAGVVKQARNFPGYEQQIFDMYRKNTNLLEGLKGPILEDKAVKDIFENHVKPTEKKYSKDKLEKLIEKESE